MNIEEEYEYEYDEELLNENGLRDGEHIYTEEDELLYRHTYVNGLLIIGSDYRIELEGMKPFIGEYKDGKPFEGYFVSYIDSEIPIVDYCEKGIIQFQYAIASLFDLDREEYSEGNYDFIKTEFKDGKPFNGIYQEMLDLGEGLHLFTAKPVHA